MLAPPDPERWRALLREVPLPPLVPVRQRLDDAAEPDLAAAVRREFARPAIRSRLRPGLRVALGVGSRGLTGLSDLVRAAVAALREAGCVVTVIPAMGSHGGATPEGQRRVLADYGVSEAAVGAPIDAGMAVREIGRLANGMPVYASEAALAHDAVVPLNRVGSHTSFRGPVESGLGKMLVIGLGKREGAQAIHARGYREFADNLLEARAHVLDAYPFPFGIATVENAAGGVARVEAVTAEALPEREPELLREAKRRSARLPFRELDVLAVRRAGKDVSGLGMDPGVTGRYATPGMLPHGDELRVTRLVLLSLTRASEGNAIGAGLADITTRRVIDATNLDATYLNATTSTSLAAARLPIAMPDDRSALQLALRTAERSPERVRMVLIRDTGTLGRFRVSEAALAETLPGAALEPLGDPAPVAFGSVGELLEPG